MPLHYSVQDLKEAELLAKRREVDGLSRDIEVRSVDHLAVMYSHLGLLTPFINKLAPYYSGAGVSPIPRGSYLLLCGR